MRWLFLLILLASLPLLAAFCAKNERNRDLILIILGALMFASGSLSLDASVMGQPDWPGPSKGVIISYVDIIALSLLITKQVGKQNIFLLSVFLMHLTLMIIVTFFAHAKAASIYSISQYAQIIMLFCALTAELQRPKALTSLLQGLALGLSVQAGFVLYQRSTGMVQAFGTTPHQNILGMMVQLSLLPILAALLEGSKSKLLYLGIIAGSVSVALGGSRASMAFFALGVALLVLLSLARRPTSRKAKIVGLGVMVSLFVVPLALETLKDRFGDAEIGTTDESRDAFERAARAMVADHPFGVGPNNFVPVNNIQGYASIGGIEWGGGLLDKPVHNAYLLARTETGWLGQAVLLMVFISVILVGLRSGFANRKSPIAGIGLGAAVAAFTISLHSNYEFAWYTIEVQRLFLVNGAIAAACLEFAKRANREDRLKKISRREKSHSSNAFVTNPVVKQARNVQHRNLNAHPK